MSKLTSTQENKAWCESYLLMEEYWEAIRAAAKVRVINEGSN
jgi:hypothetical protein